MSYHTHFTGEFTLNRPLTIAEKAKIDAFCQDRHEAAEQARDKLPDYYCPWGVNEDGTAIDGEASNEGGGSAWNYAEWLRILIERQIKPLGLTLNGEITWEGEESSDMGKLVVADNVLTIKKAKITFE